MIMYINQVKAVQFCLVPRYLPNSQHRKHIFPSTLTFISFHLLFCLGNIHFHTPSKQTKSFRRVNIAKIMINEQITGKLSLRSTGKLGKLI